MPGWAALLEWFYFRAGLDVPRFEQLKGTEVPQPYRRLLVHSADMTPTLETFFQERLHLRVLSRELQETCMREVVLSLAHWRRPVVYGAIRVFLEHLPESARKRVLEELNPLGRILQSESIPHMSWPQVFFRTEPDPHMRAMLRLRRDGPLYGRRNVLVDGTRRLLAEVVEVLAHVDEEHEPNKK